MMVSVTFRVERNIESSASWEEALIVTAVEIVQYVHSTSTPARTFQNVLMVGGR
jgi:hypothetical protein